MDASASIYANIFNTVFAHMAKLNPQLTVSAVDGRAGVPGSGLVSMFGIDWVERWQ